MTREHDRRAAEWESEQLSEIGWVEVLGCLGCLTLALACLASLFVLIKVAM